jgi:arylsulfatase A-like enzyme
MRRIRRDDRGVLDVVFGRRSCGRRKANILLIVGDDVGWGDLGAYGGGVERGIPTPSFDKIANEGMTFFDNYGQPSCTPGRAAIQTGSIPNRSGMDPGLGAEAGRLQHLFHR